MGQDMRFNVAGASLHRIGKHRRHGPVDGAPSVSQPRPIEDAVPGLTERLPRTGEPNGVARVGRRRVLLAFKEPAQFIRCSGAKRCREFLPDGRDVRIAGLPEMTGNQERIRQLGIL